MKLTPEQLAEWNALVPELNNDADDHMDAANSTDMPPQHTVNFRHAKNAHEAAWAINNLIADLEEAQRRSSISEAFAKELSADLIFTRKQLEELRAEYSVTLDNLSAAYESVRAQWNLGYAEGSQEVKHWRANHDNVVAKLRLFTQREDLPVDRLPAYEYVVELEKQLAEAQAAREAEHADDKFVIDSQAKECVRLLDSLLAAQNTLNTVLGLPPGDSSALDAAIDEAIEPYRKDAACWRFARKELSWSRAWFEQIKWVMYIEMDAPTIAAGKLRDDSVARELDAAVLAAIAAKGDPNEQP